MYDGYTKPCGECNRDALYSVTDNKGAWGPVYRCGKHLRRFLRYMAMGERFGVSVVRL
jgi:hypothetical protein